jgi:hypothetical protein
MDDARCIQPVRIERDMFERKWWGGAFEGGRRKAEIVAGGFPDFAGCRLEFE